MELVMPGVGVIFWTCLIFLLLFFILKRWAFPVINQMLKKREDNIANALEQASLAKEELVKIKEENARVLDDARQERNRLLEEAHVFKRQMESESREKAKAEYDRMLASARQDIEREKQAVLEELKLQIANVSIDMAEKVLKQELSDREKQQEWIENGLKDVKF